MNTKIKNTPKKAYRVPQVDRMKLDNEISLALESLPTGPDEVMLVPGHFNNDPFKTNLG